MLSKHKIIFGILLLCCSSCFGAGFYYVGAGFGPEMTNYKQDATIKNPDTNVGDKTHLAGQGVFGSIFAGYAELWKKCYFLALEANATISSDEFNSSNDEFFHKTFSKTEYKMVHYYGLSVLPGVMIREFTLLFARLGYAKGNFQIGTSDTSLTNINTYLDGLRYGVGINQVLNPCLSLRMEYNQINYNSKSFLVLNNSTRKHTIIAPSTNQFEIALIYQFA